MACIIQSSTNETKKDTKMIYHTSHSEIKEIHNKGLFGDVLFFSNNVYEMADANFIYSVDSDELSFIEPCQIDNEETLQEVINYAKVDEDTAFDLLAGYIDAYEICDDCEDAADLSWKIQYFQAQAAKRMGFDGCKSQDEQGAVYMIPMFGRESILTKV